MYLLDEVQLYLVPKNEIVFCFLSVYFVSQSYRVKIMRDIKLTSYDNKIQACVFEA